MALGPNYPTACKVQFRPQQKRSRDDLNGSRLPLFRQGGVAVGLTTRLSVRAIREASYFFFFIYFLIFIFTLFYFTILFWFCHTLTWICHGCTRAPNSESPSHLPPHIISLDLPRPPAPSILYPVSNIDWQFVSYLIVYIFQCHSPKSSHPLPLPQSSKVHSIHLGLFCCLHTGLSLPSF